MEVLTETLYYAVKHKNRRAERAVKRATVGGIAKNIKMYVKH